MGPRPCDAFSGLFNLSFILVVLLKIFTELLPVTTSQVCTDDYCPSGPIHNDKITQ